MRADLEKEAAPPVAASGAVEESSVISHTRECVNAECRAAASSAIMKCYAGAISPPTVDALELFAHLNLARVTGPRARLEHLFEGEEMPWALNNSLSFLQKTSWLVERQDGKRLFLFWVHQDDEALENDWPPLDWDPMVLIVRENATLLQLHTPPPTQYNFWAPGGSKIGCITRRGQQVLWLP